MSGITQDKPAQSYQGQGNEILHSFPMGNIVGGRSFACYTKASARLIVSSL